jgi:lipoprotein-releasing system permease protein
MRLAVLVMARLLRRERPAPRGVAMAGMVAVGVTILGTIGVVAGAQPRVALATVVLGGLGTFAALAGRTLAPTFAASVVGVALGVSSLVTARAVTSGFEAELGQRLARLEGHVLIGKYGLDFREHDRIASDLELDPRVVAASPFAWGSAAVAARDEVPDAREPAIAIVKGIDPGHAGHSARLLECVGGVDLASALRPADPRTMPGAIVGHRLAERLGVRPGDAIVLVAPQAVDGNPAGADAPSRRAVVEVTGLLDTGVSELDRAMLLVHLTAAQALLFGRDRVSGIEVELHDPREAAPMAAALDAALNAEHRLPRYRTSTWEQGSEATLSIVRQVRGVVTLVLGLTVMVSGGGLVGALWLLVRRKRRHIAVLAALGAARASIFWIFEVAGLAAGAIGAAAGLVLGGGLGLVLRRLRWALDPDVYPVDHLPVAFAWADALVPMAMAIGVCAAVSGPIAWAASRTRPVHAFR